MKNNEKKIREFFDGVEMSEEFREKMKRLTEEPVKKPKPLAAWRPTLIAAAVVFVCLSAAFALRKNGFLRPSTRTTAESGTPALSPDPPAESGEPAIYPDPTAERGDPALRPNPTNPKPIDPNPTAPPPSDPPPTEPKPTAPPPPDPPPTEPKPTTPPPSDPPPTEPEPTAPPPSDPPPSDPEPTEPQPTAPPATDPAPSEPSPPEPEEPGAEDQPEYEEPVSIPDPNEGYHFDGKPENEWPWPFPDEPPVVLTAVYTQTDSAQTITVTHPETGRKAVIDVTGKVTETGFRGWYRMFDSDVCVELIPRGDGFTPYAAIYE